MELKPGYKQTEAGVIPEDWICDSLENISAFITKGSTPTTYGYKWEQSGIVFLRSECVSENGLDLTQSMFISPAAHASLCRSEVCDGDILLTITGNVGRVVYLSGLGSVANLNQHIARVRVISAQTDRRYVYHFLSQASVRKNFNKISTGQAYPQISLKQVREAVVPLPPTKGEQKAIAEALSDADALIESLEQLITKKCHIKQGAMQELLTGKKRLQGFQVKAGYKQTEVGVIPEDWNTEFLGNIFEISAGRDLVKEHFSEVNNDKYCYPIYANALTNKGLYGYSKACQYEANKITVTARGDIGTAVYRSTSFNAIGRLLVLTPKCECDLRYVTDFINNFVEFAFESTGVPQLTAPQISKYQVALPSSKVEQTAIATILSDMDAEISALEAKLAKTRALKQGMMHNLLTGRIRLL